MFKWIEKLRKPKTEVKSEKIEPPQVEEVYTRPKSWTRGTIDYVGFEKLVDTEFERMSEKSDGTLTKAAVVHTYADCMYEFVKSRCDDYFLVSIDYQSISSQTESLDGAGVVLEAQEGAKLEDKLVFGIIPNVTGKCRPLPSTVMNLCTTILDEIGREYQFASTENQLEVKKANNLNGYIVTENGVLIQFMDSSDTPHTREYGVEPIGKYHPIYFKAMEENPDVLSKIISELKRSEVCFGPKIMFTSENQQFAEDFAVLYCLKIEMDALSGVENPKVKEEADGIYKNMSERKAEILAKYQK